MESWTQPNKWPGDKILPFLILQKIVFIIINLFDLKVQFVCSYWSDLTVVFANRGHNWKKTKNKHVYLSRTTGKSYNPQNVWKKCFLLHWLLLGFFVFPLCSLFVLQQAPKAILPSLCSFVLIFPIFALQHISEIIIL